MLAPVQLAGAELHSGEELAVGLAAARERHGVHDPHPGAGRQRHVPGRAGRAARSGRLLAQLGLPSSKRCSRSGAPIPRSRRGLRGHPGRAADEPRRERRQPPPRRGGPRDVAAAVARAAPSTRCRSATSPTASTCRPGSARRSASCSTATSARAGSARAAEPETWAAVDQISDEDLWAARERQRAHLVEQVRTRSANRPARSAATPATTSTRPRPRSTPHAHDRLRAARRHLQAPGPADPGPGVDARAARRRAARCRSCSPARPTLATRRPSACSSACSG